MNGKTISILALVFGSAVAQAAPLTFTFEKSDIPQSQWGIYFGAEELFAINDDGYCYVNHQSAPQLFQQVTSALSRSLPGQTVSFEVGDNDQCNSATFTYETYSRLYPKGFVDARPWQITTGATLLDEPDNWSWSMQGTIKIVQQADLVTLSAESIQSYFSEGFTCTYKLSDPDASLIEAAVAASNGDGLGIYQIGKGRDGNCKVWEVEYTSELF